MCYVDKGERGWMRRLSRLIKCGEVFVVVYSGILMISLVLHHLGVVAREPAVATALTVVNVAYLGVLAFLLVKTLREVGRELGVICFENGRCVALDDITLIYIEPGEKR
jgi:hypothetical protein